MMERRTGSTYQVQRRATLPILPCLCETGMGLGKTTLAIYWPITISLGSILGGFHCTIPGPLHLNHWQQRASHIRK
ncbi:hypothetical protein BJV77DRAFT_1019244 [Russula vinacea]|nr:hypothetical protein BJV77DRAFT_1019244 [Russula vinacea]